MSLLPVRVGPVAAPGEAVSPHFFLSYARADDDGYVGRFFQDLTDEVRRRSGEQHSEIGFRDLSSTPIGSPWEAQLAHALGTSRVFVALCSPSYFASEVCGKEWSAFEQRLHRHPELHGARAPLLLPIIWVPSTNLPVPVSNLQYDHATLGQTYAREGLHFLIRLKHYQDDYTQAVVRLAQRLIEISRDHPLPEPADAIDLGAMPNAFATDPVLETSAEDHDRPSASAARSGGGPRHVHFIVAAAAQHEMDARRRRLDQYGPRSYDWAPYRPEMDHRLCVYAQSIAASRDMTSGLRMVSDVVSLLERATERNEVVVLLVDVWSAQLDSYRHYLVSYDRRNEPATAVLVPWSRSDAETLERSDELHQSLYYAFPRNMIRRDSVFKIRLETPEDFRTALEEALVETQSRVFKHGRIARRAGGTTVVPRPVLGFPDPEETP